MFFIDEDQRVTLKDIGQKEEIKRWARECGAPVTEMALESQFRCNGSDGYLAWVDHTLEIKTTANATLKGVNYDFRVCSSANELRDQIIEKNKLRNKARLVAGYCWNWASKKYEQTGYCNSKGEFRATWNLTTDGSLWILMPESVSEVGCIHTCQGLRT